MSDGAAVAGSVRDRFLRRIREQQRQGRFPGATLEPSGRVPVAVAATDDTVALEQQFTRELGMLGGSVHQVSTAADVVAIVRGRAREGEPAAVHAGLDRGSSADAGPAGRAGGKRALGRCKVRCPPEGRRGSCVSSTWSAGLGLTGAVAAIADCGAIVVTSGPGRSRMASLLPPVHFALVSRAVLYPSAAAFLGANAPLVAASSNLVFIAGPSRTADIEMTLTRGVHGPKEIHVLFVQP